VRLRHCYSSFLTVTLGVVISNSCSKRLSSCLVRQADEWSKREQHLDSGRECASEFNKNAFYWNELMINLEKLSKHNSSKLSKQSVVILIAMIDRQLSSSRRLVEFEKQSWLAAVNDNETSCRARQTRQTCLELSLNSFVKVSHNSPTVSVLTDEMTFYRATRLILSTCLVGLNILDTLSGA